MNNAFTQLILILAAVILLLPHLARRENAARFYFEKSGKLVQTCAHGDWKRKPMNPRPSR